MNWLYGSPIWKCTSIGPFKVYFKNIYKCFSLDKDMSKLFGDSLSSLQ